MSIVTESRTPQEQTNKVKPLLLVALIVLVSVAAYIFPVFQQQGINATSEVRIYYMGTPYKTKAIFRAEEPYLPLDFLQEFIDPNIVYDEQNRMVIITTPSNVFHFPLGIKEGLLNLEPYSFTYPVIQDEEIIYLPADPLKTYYDLEIFTDQEQPILRIYNREQSIQQGIILSGGKARLKPVFRSPWTAQFVKGEEVNILKEEQGWYWVEAKDGRMGYVAKNQISLAGLINWSQENRVYQPWNPLGQPIILTWEVAGNTTVNPKEIGDLPGVNVFSPTWFHLSPEGVVVNKADLRYVRWAHERGSQVWGLFDNGFDPELSHIFLNNSQLRIKAIKQLLSYVDMYQLDGINIDFENMYLQDRNAFVNFIRELAPLLHEKERTLTVDVTFHSQSENWSLCYDRKSLAQAADYLAVMAYDENGQGSRKAGSVASLPWVEQGIQKMLEEVPADKLLLGVPFYTRLWTEETTATGQLKVTSKALSMDKAAEWILAQQLEIKTDEIAGQHYVEKKAGSITQRMWLEDSYSLQKRVEVLKKYRLAGLATWRRGFEQDDTWQYLSALANKRW